MWFSCLTQTSVPVRAASSGQAYCGVGGKTAQRLAFFILRQPDDYARELSEAAAGPPGTALADRLAAAQERFDELIFAELGSAATPPGEAEAGAGAGICAASSGDFAASAAAALAERIAHVEEAAAAAAGLRAGVSASAAAGVDPLAPRSLGDVAGLRAALAAETVAQAAAAAERVRHAHAVASLQANSWQMAAPSSSIRHTSLTW